ncbi:MAG: ankyrin repeat domain-containing protein [Campylobacteraceae bacterium]|jgi:hypothetical protein|nr:ankyrin repeat domain-containing protein [Campylobacteraceae bacterium]
MRKIVLMITFLSTMLFADKALNEELIGNPSRGCYSLEYVKELIAQGADINYVNDEGDTAFTNFARKANSKPDSYGNECAIVAYYLSSIGAVDSGRYAAHCYYASPKYDPPLVFENKHLKITFKRYDFSGSSFGILENKTDEPIYIYIETSIINGVKDSYFRKSDQRPIGRVLKANYEKDGFGMSFTPRTKKNETDYAKYPKVVNNKLKLVMEYSITYSYKGKTYEFKLPVITQELDMTYERC